MLPDTLRLGQRARFGSGEVGMSYEYEPDPERSRCRRDPRLGFLRLGGRD
jgi:hypothetical protein